MTISAPPASTTRVTGGIDLNRLARAIAPALSAAEDKLGEGEVARVQEDLSVPVEYVGDHVIRSRPGESPRMETMKLVKNVRHEVLPSGGANLPVLRVESSRPGGEPDVPHVLEFELNRPYMSKAFVRLKAGCVAFLQKFMP